MRRVVAAVVAGALALGACGGDDGGSSASGTRFDRFEGGTGTLAEYEGRPLVLNFWASWCPPCVRELPALQQVATELDGQVAFLGMNVTDDRAAAEELAARAGLTFDLAEDPDGALFTELAGISMPTTVFLDADGDVVDSHEGAFDTASLRAAIEQAFGITL